MRKNKISEVMGNINQKYVYEATAYSGEEKAGRRPVWRKWGAFAACLALIAVIGFGAIQSGLFGGNGQIVTLDNGSKINFVKSNGGASSLDIAYEIDTRALTDGEIDALFGDLPITAYALINKENNNILGLDGSYKDMKLLVSAQGVDIRDVIIDGEETASDVDGVSVNAGYFTSKKTVIYYATFKLGESTVYIEHAGAKEKSEDIRNEISTVIQKLVALENIDLTRILK